MLPWWKFEDFQGADDRLNRLWDDGELLGEETLMFPKLLLADPELAEQIALEQLLGGSAKVHTAFEIPAIKDLLKHRDIDLVILGKIKGQSPQQMVELSRSLAPKAKLLLSGNSSGLGALAQRLSLPLLPKPIDRNLLERMLRDLLPQHGETTHNGMGGPFRGFLTRCPAMLRALDYVVAVSKSGQPMMICGETGTGKDLIARALHQASGLPGRFIAVNVAGLDDTHFTDTLFGHTKGAYTGADQSRQGQVRLADKGTLFLDEIGDLNAASQIKLLRLVQEGEFLPLGADRMQRTDARIVVATNRNLEQEIETGSFREDLFYRLKTHRVDLPPLRKRPEDLQLLIDFFLSKAAEVMERTPIPSEGLAELLAGYSWPGNIRELKALIFDGFAYCHNNRELSDHLRRFIDQQQPAPDQPPLALSTKVAFGEQLPTMHEVRRLLVHEALRRTGHNRGQAAGLLGIRRQSLSHYLKNDFAKG